MGIDRNIQRHEMWPTGREFTTLEAWIYVLLKARYRAGVVHYQGVDHKVDRGELVTAIRQLARDWKWDRKRVRRVLERWVRSGSIAVQKLDRQGVHLRVSNYNTYNPDGTTNGTESGPSAGPSWDHERTKVTKKPSTTTSAGGPVENRFAGTLSWSCEKCAAGPFATFDEYLEHVQDSHPEVFGDRPELVASEPGVTG